MKSSEKILAFDIGSSGGRAQWGSFDGEALQIEEIHRFSNGPVRIGRFWYWDIFRIFEQIQDGLRQAVARAGQTPFTVGIDTWGVDYGLFDAAGELMSGIRHYRDPRTDRLYEEIFKKIDRERIYDLTGNMFIQFNTLVQLYADRCRRPWILEKAEDLLFVPDIFNYFLTGECLSEITIASTSQFFNPSRQKWAVTLFESLGLPVRILQPFIQPGKKISLLRSSLKGSLGLTSNISVVAVGSHDTASAWAAAPMETRGKSAVISLGTWSLLGMELDRPVINDASRRFNFTNECGVENTIVYHKILGGLWMIQECRRCWKESGQLLGYEEIDRAAASAKAFEFILDPDDQAFLNPDRMPMAIGQYFRQQKLSAPESVGQIARSIYESLALNYRHTLKEMEKITGRQIEVVHIVGGGSQSRLLCQLTADATGKRVVAGPVEATTIGNMLLQLKSRGHIRDLNQGREVVRRSFSLQNYEPTNRVECEAAMGRFKRLKKT